MIKLIDILNELSINNPYIINKVDSRDISKYEYMGGNEELDEFIGLPGNVMYGLKIFNIYLWLISPYISNDQGVDDPRFINKYLVYNIKYFKDLNESDGVWFPEGIHDIDPPITLQNIAIIGK